MAGHSKWKNIRYRKEAQDSRKAKVFTKIIRELTISARLGEVPADNPRLRSAIDRALSVNMSRDTIDKAITRGIGKNAENNLMEEIVYEGYGAAGIAFYVEAVTDNRNRTAGEVRHAFSKCGGNLGASGSVGYLFHKKGMIYFSDDGLNKFNLMEKAIELDGVDDLIDNDIDDQDNLSNESTLIVQVTPSHLVVNNIKESLSNLGFISSYSEINMIPDNYVSLSDQGSIEKVEKLIDMLEDLDDVQNVYTNAGI